MGKLYLYLTVAGKWVECRKFSLVELIKTNVQLARSVVKSRLQWPRWLTPMHRWLHVGAEKSINFVLYIIGASLIVIIVSCLHTIGCKPLLAFCVFRLGYWQMTLLQQQMLKLLQLCKCSKVNWMLFSISHLCHDASPSVHLSVTEVHWRIIANLGFKFRSRFTAHCGHRAAGGHCAARRAACGWIISHHASQC